MSDKSLERIAKKYNVEVIYKGDDHGHVQLKGRLLVNYYPNSKNKTAYISGMTTSKKNVAPETAVMMAIKPPEAFKTKSKRKKCYKGAKSKLFAKDPFCYWCRCELTRETMTLDHVIPLSRGGLNNANNYVAACEPCNTKRGSSMPEVKK